MVICENVRVIIDRHWSMERDSNPASRLIVFSEDEVVKRFSSYKVETGGRIMTEQSDQTPPLEFLLVPSILEDKPKCFDRPCDPSWIFWIGLVSGTGIAALFGIVNRDKLDGHRRGLRGLFVGIVLQIFSTFFYVASTVQLARGNWNDPLGLWTMLIIYIVVIIYCQIAMIFQIPRYELYCSMNLPGGSNLIPASLFIIGVLGIIANVAIGWQAASEHPYVAIH